jgi:hypothetical protein
MCPFPTAPEGLSPETLELLDNAFSSVWRELQVRKSWTALGENKQVRAAELLRSMVDPATADVRGQVQSETPALPAVERSRPRTRAIVHLPD